MHARRCVDEGCSSVTLFGTTGEGASLGVGQRATMLEAMEDAGFDLRAQVLAGVVAAFRRGRHRAGEPALRRGRTRHPARPAVLLQGCRRRRALPLVRVGDRALPRAARGDPLSHSLGDRGSALVVADRSHRARVSRCGHRRQGLERRVGIDRAPARGPSGAAHPRRRRAPARPRRPVRRLRRDQRICELLCDGAAADGASTGPTLRASRSWSTSCFGIR